jgi:hypothetical protein
METTRPRRILASQTAEAGVTVERNFTTRVAVEAVSRLSADENEALRADLEAIDDAQAAALVTGSIRYIGTRG